MLRIHRVLHATDFSPSSRTAMKYSLMLAHLLGVRTDVLHVVAGMGPHHISEYREPDDVSNLPTGDRSLAENFAALRELADFPHVQVRFLVGRGPLPGPVILDEAQREDANLIVLGAHGGGEAQPDHLGSVATDIVRRSTCPVLIIPPHVAEGAVDEKMERVVTFVTYAHLIEPVILAAAQIAHVLGARLDVLAQLDGVEQGGDTPRWREAEKNLRGLLERHKRESGETLPFEKIRFHAVGTAGSEEILKFASEQQSDMLILEAPGLASMDSPFEQAVEEIVGRAPCPVILINTCGCSVTNTVTTQAAKPERRTIDEPVA